MHIADGAERNIKRTAGLICRFYNLVAIPMLLLSTACLHLACNDSQNDDKQHWLVMNYDTHSHHIFVDINGKRFTSFEEDNRSGFESKPTPLVDGTNRISVTFEPIGDKPFNSELQFLLSPTMMPGNDLLPGFRYTPYIGTWVQWDIEVDIKDGCPGRFRYVAREWFDEQRQKLYFEERVDSDIYAKSWEHQHCMEYTLEGKPFIEYEYEGDYLRAAKCYAPGGELGSEVVDGVGKFTKWYEDGQVYRTTEYTGGLSNGPCREYGGDKNVLIEGQYRDDLKDGRWVRYDDEGNIVAQSTFENGELVSGEDDFPEFE